MFKEIFTNEKAVMTEVTLHCSEWGGGGNGLGAQTKTRLLLFFFTFSLRNGFDFSSREVL